MTSDLRIHPKYVSIFGLAFSSGKIKYYGCKLNIINIFGVYSQCYWTLCTFTLIIEL